MKNNIMTKTEFEHTEFGIGDKMKLTPEQIKIIEGKICPYCKKESQYVDSKIVYGKSYGMIYLCTDCDAYVGVHKGTDNAKGRLANAELRQIKKKAHFYFDPIWQFKLMTRHEAYKWLSDKIKLPPEYTHIGMLGKEKTIEVIVKSIVYLENHGYFEIEAEIQKDPEW